MKLLRSRAKFFLALCLLQVPVAWLLDDFWVVDASSHFLPQQLALFFVSLVVWSWRDRWRWAAGWVVAMFAMLIMANRIPASVIEISFEEPPVRSPDLQVISFNVLTSNPRKTETAEWVLSTLSDRVPNVVVLVEPDQAWVEALKILEKRLPYSRKMPRGDNFGMAVYSSLPIEDGNGEAFEEICGIPQFMGLLETARGSLKLIATHTVPPAPDSIPYRNACLREIERFALEGDGPAITAGDLNCAPWAACFPRKLEDPFPFLTRPHTWSILGGAVSTALDHVLHTKHVRVLNPRVGPDLGSDHLPVVADVYLEK